MRKERGITLIALVITIILILILAGIAGYEGIKLIQQSNLQTINANMLLIQAKAQTLAEKAEFSGDKENNLKGEKVDNIASEEPLIKAGITTGEYYKWDATTLEENGLSGVSVKNGEVYYVNYQVGEVADVEVVISSGYKHVDGNVYYKLSDIKNLSISD